MAHKEKMIERLLHDSEGPVDTVAKGESDTALHVQDSVQLETAPCPILLVGQRNAVSGQEWGPWGMQAKPTKVNRYE